MDHGAQLQSIADDAAGLRAAAWSAGLSAAVPSCPGWTVADLVRHVGEVFQFWGAVVSDRATNGRDVRRPDAIADDRLFDAFDLRLAGLLVALQETGPATEVWTWSDDHTVGFVIRRMAQETAVHRWDAERAAGIERGIDSELASDGIDEFLEHFLPDSIEGATAVGGSVHIHCGDVAGEWTMHRAADGFTVSREHAKGDCALRGTASDLLLALWRRVGIDAIDVVGDADVAERFLASTNLD